MSEQYELKKRTIIIDLVGMCSIYATIDEINSLPILNDIENIIGKKHIIKRHAYFDPSIGSAFIALLVECTDPVADYIKNNYDRKHIKIEF